MSGVEAAASLFGVDESSSDPFAALGTDMTQSPSDALFYHDPAPSSSNFLNSESSSEEKTYSEPFQPYAQSEPENSNYYSASYTPVQQASRDAEQPSYFEGPGAGTGSTMEHDNQHSQPQGGNTITHDPYAPISYQRGLEPPVYPQTRYDATTSSDPYIPASSIPAQPSAYAYSPSSVSLSSTSTHTSSYTPTIYSTYTPLDINSPPVLSQSPPQIVPTASPVATISRPKVSNAYDPPFLTSKPGRRNVRTSSGQQSFIGYNTYQALPPPTLETYSKPSQYSSLASAQQQSLPHGPPSYQQPYSSGGNTVRPTAIDTPIPNAHTQGVSTVHQAEIPLSYQSLSLGSRIEVHNHKQVMNESSTGSTWDLSYSTLPVESNDTNQENGSYSLQTVQHGVHNVEQSQASSGSRVHTPPVPYSPISYSGHLRTQSPHQYALPASPVSIKNMSLGRSSPLTESDNSPTSTKVSGLPQVESMGNTKPDNFHALQLSIAGQRTSSPAPIAGTVNANGTRNPQMPYLSKSLAGDGRAFSPTNSLNGQRRNPLDPYAPKSYPNDSGDITSSPGPSLEHLPSGSPVAIQPIKANGSTRNDMTHHRSMSNTSALSAPSAPSIDSESSYVPSQSPFIDRRQGSEGDYEGYTSRYNYLQGQESSHNIQPTRIPQYPQTQEILVKPLHTPYAPSPSLLGANDPLGRTVARVPVFSFGFGGKFVTCFHGATSLMTGFDVALSSRNSTGVHVRVLKNLIPDSALNTSTALFPGPLFSDPGISSGLVRTGVSTQTKTKKANVIKYLSQRAEEIAMELQYLHPGGTESYQVTGKLTLVKLLRILVENDGRLTGSPQLDNAVRVALVPRLEHSVDPNGSLVTAEGFPSDLAPVSYPNTVGAPTQTNENVISVTRLRPSVLDAIEDLLLRGERRQAYHFALDEKLWAHAMVIASSIDKDAWKEVVNEFLKIELGANTTSRTGSQPSEVQVFTNGRESLRVAYSLFSGQGASAVQELIPQTILSKTTTARLQQTIVPHMTPRTPNFTQPAAATAVPTEALSQWAETAAMIVTSPLPPETSAAITALGDQLVANHMYEAAHVCYLLAPQTSTMGGIGNPSARIVLVGSRNPQNLPRFSKDSDCFIFSEIVEFALSLTPTPRGQDAFQGIPHLQAYRFIRAVALAEIGDISLASRYCEAITAAINRNSPYFTPTLVDQLKGLSDRIAGVAHVDKTGSWMGAKLSKPSLDTIGGWLENRFTKIVTGDADTDTPPEEELTKEEDRSSAGPFAHYSTISSATPSARSSPQPSLVNFNTMPPHRSGSAMASSSPYSYPQIDRASSAMDYMKRKPSPGPRISSAGATTTTFTSAPSFGQVLNNDQSASRRSSHDDVATARPSLQTEDGDSVQEATWWGSSAYDESSTARTPTASTFLRVDEGALTPSSDGFISLMDNDIYSVASKSPTNSTLQPSVDDEEDLGFGNSKRDKSSSGDELHKAPASDVPVPKETAPPSNASAPVTNGSWISRWWKRSDSATPGPIKASLGEESAFYYDKEQKRWINKKAGDNDRPQPILPPPPPSRAQTTSPGLVSQRFLGSSEAGPPPRSASAIDLSTSPPSRTVMRVRSNLVPTPESAPSTPTGTRLGPPGPPPGRPKSQASKRNIRNRYVDVLQQEGGT